MIAACSEAQIIPLSKDLLKIRSVRDLSKTAVFSIKHGTLPGPTPSAGFPEE